ncbi:MAG: hypothetical protein ABI551_23610 [Polyangiaceae bacterium]
MKARLLALASLPAFALACGSTPPMPQGPPPEYEPSPIYSGAAAATAAPPTGPAGMPNVPLPSAAEPTTSPAPLPPDADAGARS